MKAPEDLTIRELLAGPNANHGVSVAERRDDQGNLLWAVVVITGDRGELALQEITKAIDRADERVRTES